MFPDSEKIIEEAIQKAKDCLEYNNFDYGQQILEQVLRCDPDHQSGLQLLGVLFWKWKKYQDAIPYFERAIILDPTNPDNYNNLSLCELNLGNSNKSIELLKKSIELDPDNLKFKNNLAIQYRQQRDYCSAINLLESVIKDYPDDVTVLINLAGMYGETHRLDDCENILNHCLSIDNENANAHVDMAYAKALKGDFNNAWKHYEYRFKHFENLWFYNNKYDQNKRWKTPNTDLNQKTLILYAEQGLGDAIQFVRYIPLVKEKYNCTIILHCSDALKNLFQKNLPIDDFITTNIISIDSSCIPYHDYHASIMSLPYLLNMDYIPNNIYIHSENQVDFKEEKFKIGICWTGSPMHPHDSIRSCKLKYFECLKNSKVKLYNFQENMNPKIYTSSPNQKIDYTENADLTLVDLKEHINDFNSTANLLTGIDLLITVDTVLIHLAGAMGIPTIGLLSYNPDWRWKLEGRTTEWYPSVRFIRQEFLGDWDGVFIKLKKEICDLLPN